MSDARVMKVWDRTVRDEHGQELFASLPADEYAGKILTFQDGKQLDLKQYSTPGRYIREIIRDLDGAIYVVFDFLNPADEFKEKFEIYSERVKRVGDSINEKRS